MLQITSQHVLSRHPGSGKPKIIQVAYNNGRIDQVHCHNRGQQTRTTIREGLKAPPRQVQQRCLPPIDHQILYNRVIQRHSITNAPKVVETKFTNGRILHTHYHNDGKVDKKWIN